MKRKGLIGGTFDPVHIGHISLASDAMNQACLEEVIFMPAGHQPFKLDKKISSAKDRIAMLNLATEGKPGMVVSDMETDIDDISYTYRTLDAVREKLGSEYRLYFITGTDSFLKMETWRNADELLKNNSFIVGSRPGYRIDELDECIRRLEHKYGTETILLKNRRFDVSSTEIRNRAEHGESLSGLVPENVERYIKEHGLYR